MKGLILWQLLSNSDFRTGTITSSAISKGQTNVPTLPSMTMPRSFSAMFSAESIVSTTGRDLSRRTKMIDTKCELTVARTMLSAKVEVVLRRESRERHIREKALRALHPMEEKYTDVLLLDEEDGPIIIEQECQELQPIIKDFVQCYVENNDKPVEVWLEAKMREQLPNASDNEIKSISSSIIESLETTETKKQSLQKSVQSGRSKESWFASEMVKATSGMSAQQASKYLAGLDTALQNANEALYRTITTQAGAISRNPNLDGFIAEQYHAQTFNLNAAARNSEYTAKVLEPNGNGYAKNSVDIVIVDGNGKTVKRYQSKYCKDATATEQAFEHGDYRGQQKLVPNDQQSGIKKKTTTVIESPDGTTSNRLSKKRAEEMRNEAQSGKWNELNWNEYATKDLALGIGKQAGQAALQGAAISVGFDIAQKLWEGEEIEGADVVETALKGGADFGIKAAAAGALKVGAEKEIIKFIPKGTPASTITNIAFVAIEDAKVMGEMVTGDLSVKEGIEKIEQTTVSTAAGLVAMGEGSTIGAAIGTVFGPVGSAIGGFIGGTVGYIAGSKVGEAVVKGAQKIRDGAIKVAKKIVSGVKTVGSAIVSGVKSLCSGIASFFGF